MLTILGVTITSKMSVSEHVRFVTNSCAQTIHAIRILRSQGMDDAQLQLIYRAVVIAKLTYASSSWWGFTSASDKQRLDAFLRRGRRYGLYPADQPTIVQLIEEADETLFNNIRHIPPHILHPLLLRLLLVLGPDLIILNLPTIMTIEMLLIECSFAIPVA